MRIAAEHESQTVVYIHGVAHWRQYSDSLSAVASSDSKHLILLDLELPVEV